MVGNLPRDITGSDLRVVFESFGRVETVDVVRRCHADESRGFGFVGMPARSEAVRAVLGVHGRNVKGQAITATEVRPRDPVAGACCARCHCRSGTLAAGDTHHPGRVPEAREKRWHRQERIGTGSYR
jgi:RNA recognition motif-containing protein